MKIRIVGEWEFLLIPEGKTEEGILQRVWDGRHVHFVCKAMVPTRRTKKRRKIVNRLLLTPSLQRWKALGFKTR
jgi:hypothetical protein